MLDFSIPASTADILIRLSVAALLGGMIGFERDLHGRSAGLRTHLLVCLGSALFMVISLASSAFLSGEANRIDPTRIAAQIVTGIGFLGAGVVIKHGVTVRGLTTAACLWVTAALGMAAAGGMYWVAVFVATLTVIALVGLNAFERAFRHDTYRQLVLRTGAGVEVARILGAVRKAGVTVLAFELDRDDPADRLTVRVSIRIFHRGTTEPIAQKVLESIHTEGIPIDRFSWLR